jgi:sodium pump decarboxylase gamma subunit
MANFSDTFAYTLIITLFGMGIVFIVLILLQYILKSMGVVFNREKKEVPGVTEVLEAKAVETATTQMNNTEAADDDQLVAVITAAVISCLGGKSNIVVRNIRRVDDLTPVWGKVSRAEQMGNRF